MYFMTKTQILNILFEGWDTWSWKEVLLASFVIGVLTVIYEALKFLKSYMVLRRSLTSSTIQEDDTADSGYEITSMDVELIDSSSPEPKFSVKKAVTLLAESGAHMLKLLLGYVLMLLVMTYSVWFLVSVLVGSGAGYLLCLPVSQYLTTKTRLSQKSGHGQSTLNDVITHHNSLAFSINEPDAHEV